MANMALSCAICCSKANSFSRGPILHRSRRCRASAGRHLFESKHSRHIYTTRRLDLQSSTTTAGEDVNKEISERKAELDRSGIKQHPRYADHGNNLTLQEFASRFKALIPGQREEGARPVRVAGRVIAIRKSGGKLAFIDIGQEPGNNKIQLMLNLGRMESVEKKDFSDRVKLIARGDIVSAEGTPTRTSSGELSLLANSMPTILSPCLHQIPLTSYQSQTTNVADVESLQRHVQMLTDPSVILTMTVRSTLIKAIRSFFDSRDFLEVQTPILAAAAGGATARPFETVATEFEDRKLWLRVAPELWLKRLVLGGMSRIYEIGPSFRNEGLDRTHNPEFTTCEFYAAYHDLQQLQRLTESLLRSISAAVGQLDLTKIKSAVPPPSLFEGEFPSIDFIPALNNALGEPLPNLAEPSAQSHIIQIFRDRSIPLPNKPTLPRLLDKLSTHYLEPQCTQATWIINTPECLSPLAKSFVHPDCANNQSVAARGELFIHSRELVNCYEEENSPFEQRRKFIDQQNHARLDAQYHRGMDDQNVGHDRVVVDDEAQPLDDDYLRALEWGLPPTGGWGCGIDRLVMLFTGKERIGDVLSFGNLRSVARGAERRANEER